MSLRFFVIFCFSFSNSFLAAAEDGPRRLEVLFLGDDRGHKPLDRYRVMKAALGPQGINLTFEEDLAKLNRANLDRYDALLVYANHEQDQVPNDILPWIRDGGALVALHSACGNFHPSKAWFDLVGGKFKSHEGHEFSPKNVDLEHPITRELPVLKCWDETYQHQDLTADRHLLQVREPINKGETEPEPWSWTRNEGKGRVFYTASGHDLRCWNEVAYQELVKRGILWTIGEKRAERFSKFKLPPLVVEIPEVANRAHPEIPMMALQKPLSPSDSALHTQVPVGSKLVLFASEPMVKKPIAIDWDERGRAWVIESFGYPNDVPDEVGSGEDRIKILEDTDGDGKADKMTVFAEGLRHCTTSVFVNGGLVVTDGKDIVYLRDRDGDGKSDERKVLATGLNIHDTHASVSHFQYGLDNWIYATVGYSGVKMNLQGEKHEFGQGVFRFLPDLSKLEFLQKTTNNTWGLGITEDGDVMGSTANHNPSWIHSMPASVYAGSGIEPSHTPRTDDSPFIFPITRDVTQVDQIDHFTAAAGHFFYNDQVLAGTFAAGDAFVCEPTGHVVAVGAVSHRDSLKQTLFRGNNAYASSDAWSAPVAARTGPDGALWIVDWYNPIVQHNVVFRFYNAARQYDQAHSPFHTGAMAPGKGNAYETPLRDREHGRIWRIVPIDGSLRKSGEFDVSRPESLIDGLGSPSQLIRLHAQRLIVERGGDDLVKRLAVLVADVKKPLAALHAVWVIKGLGAKVGGEGHRALTEALGSAHPSIRRQAMIALGASDAGVIAALPNLIRTTRDLRELLFVLTAAAQTGPNQPIGEAIWSLVSTGISFDPPLMEAARLAMRRQGVSLVAASMIHLNAETTATWFGKEVLEVMNRLAVGPNRPALEALAKSAPEGPRSYFNAALESAPQTAVVAADLPEPLRIGRDAYMKACIECHQADGKGVVDTFPPLVDSEWVKGSADTMLRIMLGGLAGPIEINGLKFNSVMPGHSHLGDEEIAAIANFVRFSFGGIKEASLTAAQVKALRPDVEQRKFNPWIVEDLLQLEKSPSK